MPKTTKKRTSRDAYFEITLGDTYTDTVTGFSGVAKAYILYLSGKDEQVQLAALVNGTPVESWFESSAVVKKETNA